MECNILCLRLFGSPYSVGDSMNAKDTVSHIEDKEYSTIRDLLDFIS